MFEVFTEEVEVLIKDGVANLYWYKKDLRKAWIRAGVPEGVWEKLIAAKNDNGSERSKRQMMDGLYEWFRCSVYERRLEISRNFVRLLVDHRDFARQDEKHKVEIAERTALKLRELIREQIKEREYREAIRAKTKRSAEENYHVLRNRLNEQFVEARELNEKERGYKLEKLFCELMRISNIPVEEPFKIVGEQIDGAIRHDGHFYLVEIRWREAKANQPDIASLLLKAEGKLEARALFLSMNGYTSEMLSSLPKGKNLRVILLDGVHLANVLSGVYTFVELLEHAISQASTRGNIYCSTDLSC